MAIFLAFMIAFAVIAFLILPIIEICGNPQFCITGTISNTCGHCAMTILVLLLYPFFVIVLIFEALYYLCKTEDMNNDDIRDLFKEIGFGLRNIIMMPCVLCVNP